MPARPTWRWRHCAYAIPDSAPISTTNKTTAARFGIRAASASGTAPAAIVSPIAALVEGDGREYALREACAVAKRVRESLLAIQERRAPDPFGWTQDVTLN